jgi:hypothetical protein
MSRFQSRGWFGNTEYAVWERIAAYAIAVIYGSDWKIASGSISSEPTRKPIAPSNVNTTDSVMASIFAGPGKKMANKRLLTFQYILRRRRTCGECDDDKQTAHYGSMTDGLIFHGFAFIGANPSDRQGVGRVAM